MTSPNDQAPERSPFDDLPLGLRNRIEAEGGGRSAEEQELPPVHRQLCDWLERLWPPSLPGVDVSLAAIQREAGRQEVIHMLRSISNAQE